MTKWGRDTAMFNVAERFNNCNGLFVDSSFDELVSKPLVAVETRAYISLKPPILLDKDMSNLKICEIFLGKLEGAKEKAVCPSQIYSILNGGKFEDGTSIVRENYYLLYTLVKDSLISILLAKGSGNSSWSLHAVPFEERGYWLAGRHLLFN